MSRASRKTKEPGRDIIESAASLIEADAKVSLRVIVPERRSPRALHFFLQSDDQPYPGPPAVKEASLVLVQYLTSGRLWDTYRAVLSAKGLPAKQLIAKITSPDTYDEGYVEREEFFLNSRAATRAYQRQAAMYSGPLAGLQGGAVPAVYGSFEGVLCVSLGPYGRSRVRIELLEDVGEPAAGKKGLRDLPLADRRKILDVYRQLHSARVDHSDNIVPRHIRRRADGRFALIDFAFSRKVRLGAEGDAWLASELAYVAGMLGLRRKKKKVADKKVVTSAEDAR